MVISFKIFYPISVLAQDKSFILTATRASFDVYIFVNFSFLLLLPREKGERNVDERFYGTKF